MGSRTISTKLVIAFGCLISLLVGVGWLALFEMSQMNRHLDEIVYHRWVKATQARQALNLSNLNNRITMQIFMLKDARRIGELLAQRDENSRKITQLIERIRQEVESESERRLL